MDMTRVNEILRASLSDLVSEPIAVRPLDSVVAQWDLPLEDLQELLRYGLPAIDGKLFQPDSQHASDPEPHAGGLRLYRLGSLGSHYVVGSVEHSSAVIAHSDEPQRRGGTFNSSLRLFVDAVWRWSRLLPILEEAEDESVYDALDRFLDHERERDPSAAIADSWMWAHLADGW